MKSVDASIFFTPTFSKFEINTPDPTEDQFHTQTRITLNNFLTSVSRKTKSHLFCDIHFDLQLQRAIKWLGFTPHAHIILGTDYAGLSKEMLKYALCFKWREDPAKTTSSIRRGECDIQIYKKEVSTANQLYTFGGHEHFYQFISCPHNHACRGGCIHRTTDCFLMRY